MDFLEILGQYRAGSLSLVDALSEFQKLIDSMCCIAEKMEGLDMLWTLGTEGKIIASLKILVENKQTLIIPKLYISSKDIAQIPSDYLLNGRLAEVEERKVFFHLLGENGVFLDVGANVGWYSILAALSGASAYAFEPIPETYKRLCDNIQLNKISTIKAFHLGLGEKAEEQLFYYHQKASGASSRADLDYLSDGMAQKIQCLMDTLDNVCRRENIDRVDLIKCDVEGGELFVFRGAVETIKKHRPYVLSEMLRKWSAKFNYYPDEIINLFKDLNYKCIALRKDKPGSGYIMDHMLETTEETNFLFIPEEKEATVRTFMSIT